MDTSIKELQSWQIAAGRKQIYPWAINLWKTCSTSMWWIDYQPSDWTSGQRPNTIGKPWWCCMHASHILCTCSVLGKQSLIKQSTSWISRSCISSTLSKQWGINDHYPTGKGSDEASLASNDKDANHITGGTCEAAPKDNIILASTPQSVQNTTASKFQESILAVCISQATTNGEHASSLHCSSKTAGIDAGSFRHTTAEEPHPHTHGKCGEGGCSVSPKASSGRK